MDLPCICEGNWRTIVHEVQPLIGRSFRYRFSHTTRYVFIGVLWGADDFYYVMYDTDSNCEEHLSCVGSLEQHGFTLME